MGAGPAKRWQYSRHYMVPASRTGSALLLLLLLLLVVVVVLEVSTPLIFF
jgi:hypothetical protein